MTDHEFLETVEAIEKLARAISSNPDRPKKVRQIYGQAAGAAEEALDYIKRGEEIPKLPEDEDASSFPQVQKAPTTQAATPQTIKEARKDQLIQKPVRTASSSSIIYEPIPDKIRAKWKKRNTPPKRYHPKTRERRPKPTGQRRKEGTRKNSKTSRSSR